MVLHRDPASELFDAAARQLLARAYRHPGTWQKTRLTAPGPRQRAYLAGHGIDPDAPDQPSIPGRKSLNARTRWARAFVRALYYQHKWWSPRARGQGWRSSRRTVARPAAGLEVQVGRWLPALGAIPAGRAIQVKYTRPPATRRHGPVSRRSDSTLRDW